MSTVRFTPRRSYRRRALVRIDPRALLVVAALCATSFAGAFAVGRLARSGGATREAAAPIVPVVSAAGGIPTRLSSAPTIQIQPPPSVVRRSSAPPPALAAPLPGPSPQPFVTPATGSEGAAAPAPEPAPAAPAPSPPLVPARPVHYREAPAPTAAPKASSPVPAGGGASHAPAPGVKHFDTSG
jgi:hypothetical protein